MSPFRLYIYRLITFWFPETRFFGLKAALLRWCGAKIGSNVRIHSLARFSGNGRLEIGDDVWIGADTFVSPIAPEGIVIGSHVDIGPNVMILTGTHEITPNESHIAAKGCAKSTRIGDGCWLGARSTILPGVSVPSKTVVAAGAVVTTAPEDAGWLLAGIPAVAKKKYNIG